MNISVRIPPTLLSAVEGRRELNLGLPPTADIGDLVDTLFSLYPRLRGFVPSDRGPAKASLSLFLSEASMRDLARRRAGLREGMVVYLVGGAFRREAGVVRT